MVKVRAKALTFTMVMVAGEPRRKRVRPGEVIEWIGDGEPPRELFVVLDAGDPAKRKPGRPKKDEGKRISDTLVSSEHLPDDDGAAGVAGFESLPS